MQKKCYHKNCKGWKIYSHPIRKRSFIKASLFFHDKLYQRLMLGSFSDVDGFEVNMGNPHQWLGRVGGRLTQMLIPADKDYALSLYGKLNVMKAFGDKGKIQIGDTFLLDSAESSIEGGFGVNAQLSQNIALHGDVSYQQKLQRAGLSGINVSGGLRYQF